MKLKKALISTLAGLMLSLSVPAKGEPIKRNNVSFDVNHSELELNKKTYQKGLTSNSDIEINQDVVDWLNLRAKVNFRYQKLAMLEQNATEDNKLLNTSLEGRVKLYSSKDLKLFVGTGIDSVYNKEKMVYEGRDGSIERNVVGPMVGFSLESKYVDLFLNGSIMLGEKNTSYDKSRDIREEHVKLEIVPRYWRVELPMKFDSKTWAITNNLVDRQNIHLNFKIQPTYNVVSNFAVFLNFDYNQRWGSDDFSQMDFGGGVKLKW